MPWVTVCILLVGCVGVGQAQWTLQNSGSAADLRGIEQASGGTPRVFEYGHAGGRVIIGKPDVDAL